MRGNERWDGALEIRVNYCRGEWCGVAVRTPKRSRLSSRWRGMMETSSISHKNATSGGVRPGGRGNAMVVILQCVWELDRRSCDVQRVSGSRLFAARELVLFG